MIQYRTIFASLFFIYFLATNIAAAQTNTDQAKLLVYLQNADPGGIWTVSDAKQRQLDEVEWTADSGLIRMYSLEPGTYKINIPGPIKTLEIDTQANNETFLEIASYSPDDGDIGIRVTSWTGKPSTDINNAINNLKEAGLEKFLTPTRLEPADNALYFSYKLPPGVKPPPNE